MTQSAFPSNQYATGVSPSGHSEGMTLRDYFAAKAMQGILSMLEDDGDQIAWGVVAEDSYKMATAMLNYRNGNS